MSTIASQFNWNEYLQKEKAKAVSADELHKLSNANPFPNQVNPFKIGWILEAIDPQHQSKLALVSVAKVLGQRMQLHFVGFSKEYDFWVYCDSPFIFPCGFSATTGRILIPPPDFCSESFDWKEYARQNNLQFAPTEAFCKKTQGNTTGFRIHDRLEAVNRQRSELVCVASIADVISDYLLIHLDGWSPCYDYWTLKTSNCIKPIGWCKENQKPLSPPLGYEHKPFDWKQYLKSKSLKAAESGLFNKNPSHGLTTGSKLEVVDPRNQIVTRVATISEIDNYRVQIHFDGWSCSYDIWMYTDNRDLHPIGWASKYGETLLTPLDFLTIGNRGKPQCSTFCCLGHGHVSQGKFIKHHTKIGCPYSPQNLERDPLPDRLLYSSILPTGSNSFIVDKKDKKNSINFVSNRKRPEKPRSCSRTKKRRFDFSKSGDICPGKSGQKSEEPELFQKVSERDRFLYKAISIASLMEKKSEKNSIHLWKNCFLSPQIIKTKDVREVKLWSPENVSTYIHQLIGKPDCAQVFRLHKIDGEKFLTLSQSFFTSVLKLKLGPSLKIYDAILNLKCMIDNASLNL